MGAAMHNTLELGLVDPIFGMKLFHIYINARGRGPFRHMVSPGLTEIKHTQSSLRLGFPLCP